PQGCGMGTLVVHCPACEPGSNAVWMCDWCREFALHANGWFWCEHSITPIPVCDLLLEERAWSDVDRSVVVHVHCSVSEEGEGGWRVFRPPPGECSMGPEGGNHPGGAWSALVCGDILADDHRDASACGTDDV